MLLDLWKLMFLVVTILFTLGESCTENRSKPKKRSYCILRHIHHRLPSTKYTFPQQAKTQNIKPRPMRATAWFRVKCWLLIGRECRHVFGLQRCHCGSISEDCIFQHHLILSIIGGRCYSIEAMFFSADYFQIHEIFLLKSVDMLKKINV